MEILIISVSLLFPLIIMPAIMFKLAAFGTGTNPKEGKQ